MGFHVDLLTLYPDMFPGPLGHSLSGRALEREDWALTVTQIRDFAEDRHRTVDDAPFGGGPGMVMKADVIARALDAIAPPDDRRPRILLSPRGAPFTQARARRLSAGPGLVLVCGRFEGVDERVIEARDLEEVSIGDYVLSGGELAAMVILDAVARLLPGVMGNAASGDEESFESGLLEAPHYTRPQEFEGRRVPEPLLSGDHRRITEWRRRQAETLTRRRRPDLVPPDGDGD